ncbi:MAG: hypothetical protein A2283_20365 [Lentisphaerae bacterium RIFOXYA12_FULL_48_11]|nr:MAG: hypothetical protein A2283_20365 [Lentisphaerae bacterium RIFOXYA12_FULL_48_11]
MGTKGFFASMNMNPMPILFFFEHCNLRRIRCQEIVKKRGGNISFFTGKRVVFAHGIKYNFYKIWGVIV